MALRSTYKFYSERIKGINKDMGRGLIQVYSGNGYGKSSTALGRALNAASKGENVVIISFLKGCQSNEFLERMEPEIKIFCFEKSGEEFSQLSEERRQEEIRNIRNGLNFAKKVLTTGECGLLILDEVLGIIDNGIISMGELRCILGARGDDVDIIMTGIKLNDEICALADDVFQIEPAAK